MITCAVVAWDIPSAVMSSSSFAATVEAFGQFTGDNYSLRESLQNFHKHCAEQSQNPGSGNSPSSGLRVGTSPVVVFCSQPPSTSPPHVVQCCAVLFSSVVCSLRYFLARETPYLPVSESLSSLQIATDIVLRQEVNEGFGIPRCSTFCLF